MDQKECQELLAGIDKYQGKRIVVVGDLLVDEYLYGVTSRISREAPVLIVKYLSSEFKPGGAANAIANLATLGAKVSACGVVGDDQAGQKLLEMLSERGADVSGVVVADDYPTVTKTRIMAGSETTRKQQVLRIDREFEEAYSDWVEEQMAERLVDSFKDCHGLLVSDYGTGTLGEKMKATVNSLAAKEAQAGWDSPDRRFICVDSRFNLNDYKQVYALTPNEEELGNACARSLHSSEDAAKAASDLMARTDPAYTLLTRGRKGMMLFHADGTDLSIPIFGSDEVTDVTGAGDTVVTTFLLSLCTGHTISQAAYIANYAASQVVMKAGAATVTTKEIKRAILADQA